jgi:hypothetical protein
MQVSATWNAVAENDLGFIVVFLLILASTEFAAPYAILFVDLIRVRLTLTTNGAEQAYANGTVG